jgi:hypothetical protein
VIFSEGLAGFGALPGWPGPRREKPRAVRGATGGWPARANPPWRARSSRALLRAARLPVAARGVSVRGASPTTFEREVFGDGTGERGSLPGATHERGDEVRGVVRARPAGWRPPARRAGFSGKGLSGRPCRICRPAAAFRRRPPPPPAPESMFSGFLVDTAGKGRVSCALSIGLFSVPAPPLRFPRTAGFFCGTDLLATWTFVPLGRRGKAAGGAAGGGRGGIMALPPEPGAVPGGRPFPRRSLPCCRANAWASCTRRGCRT